MQILKTENKLSGPEISLFLKEIKRYAEVGISIIRVLTMQKQKENLSCEPTSTAVTRGARCSEKKRHANQVVENFSIFYL